MKKKVGLTTKIFIALAIGAVFGFLIKLLPNGFIKDTIFLNGIIKILGKGFISAIKMLVVPLVFASITCGVASLSNIKSLGRIGGRTLIFYLSTTAIAISIAIGLALIIKPGSGLDMSNIIVQQPEIGQTKPLSDVILNIIPTNPIKSMVEGEMLQVIFFSVLFGATISILGEKAKPVKDVMLGLNEICLKMVNIIMNFAPFGIFALIAETFATTGFDAFGSLIKYMFVIMLALAIHACVVYSLSLKVFTGLSVKPFFKKIADFAAITFSTASSSAALPATMKTMKSLGVHNKVSSFTLPLGATINMDGTAIMQGVATVFIAQIYGIELSINSIITVIITATLASVGTAAVPGVGLVMLSMVLNSVGLPIEGIGLIMGVDRILDMCRTTVNVIGDCICTLIVSKKENALDEDMYYGDEEEEMPFLQES